MSAKKVILSTKVVVIGNQAVGKTSITIQFVKNEFSDFYEPTVGAAFLSQSMTVEGYKTVNFQIWDTAGY